MKSEILRFACLLLIFGANASALASDRNTSRDGFTEPERSELLQTLVFLACNRTETLSNRMERLSPYHNLLIRSWLLSGNQDVLSVSNQIGGTIPMSLSHNQREAYDEFRTSWQSSLERLTGRKLTPDEREQRTLYWDKISEAALDLLQEHLDYGAHSAQFVGGALIATDWLRISEGRSEKAFELLRLACRSAGESQTRHAAFKAIYSFQRRHPDILKEFVASEDVYIAQASSFGLASRGEAPYLPNYVRATWRLRRQKPREEGLLGGPRDPDNFLNELVPQSGYLFSEQSQLSWLEGNIHLLSWDNKTGTYIVRK